MERLLNLAKLLRDPENGCPWDCEQTFASFKQCLVNETAEVVQAIEREDYANLCEELGDTLFNLVFLVNLAEEQGLFTMQQVVEGVFHKMVKRHPHVFGTHKAENATAAYQSFIKAKRTEQGIQVMTREDAWQLLCQHTHSDRLRKHALAVEAAMAACARRFAGDEEKWKIVGLLHDMDYEQYPEQHPLKCIAILKEYGYAQDIQRAILCHVADTGFKAQNAMEKSLCAVDELSSFIVAVALVRPSKKLADVKVKSVKKKLKDKSFARAVNRREIYHGAELLEDDLDQHIEFVIEALKPVAPVLGT